MALKIKSNSGNIVKVPSMKEVNDRITDKINTSGIDGKVDKVVTSNTYIGKITRTISDNTANAEFMIDSDHQGNSDRIWMNPTRGWNERMWIRTYMASGMTTSEIAIHPHYTELRTSYSNNIRSQLQIGNDGVGQDWGRLKLYSDVETISNDALNIIRKKESDSAISLIDIPESFTPVDDGVHWWDTE